MIKWWERDGQSLLPDVVVSENTARDVETDVSVNLGTGWLL